MSKKQTKRTAETLKKTGAINEDQKKIVSDLTSKLIDTLFPPVIENIQYAASNNEEKTLEAATKLFMINNN